MTDKPKKKTLWVNQRLARVQTFEERLKAETPPTGEDPPDPRTPRYEFEVVKLQNTRTPTRGALLSEGDLDGYCDHPDWVVNVG